MEITGRRLSHALRENPLAPCKVQSRRGRQYHRGAAEAIRGGPGTSCQKQLKVVIKAPHAYQWASDFAKTPI